MEMSRQALKDSYKAGIIDECMQGMKNDEWYSAKLKGTSTKAIDLDKTALEILKAFYEGKKIIIKDADRIKI